ncbi:MAG: intradiol ring-cleavage dioxygenase, partial [Flavobacteriaceae bacterium]|nr:intradiol ring-cleavage dioxygenase [Flavobacteriaceae bacterium]
MTHRYTFVFSIILTLSACGQQTSSANNTVNSCEGCKAYEEYGDKRLTSVDTLPDFDKNGPHILLTGTVFQYDRKTPAEDVILYIYHTNREGIYPKTGNEKGHAKRHGYLRGWVKTNERGDYAFYTFRPGAYPS